MQTMAGEPANSKMICFLIIFDFKCLVNVGLYDEKTTKCGLSKREGPLQ
jgi:hypothetical protein